PQFWPTAATASPVARERSPRRLGFPELATGPAFQRSRAAFPCSSPAVRVPGRLVVPAGASFRYCFGSPEFLSHALLMGIRNADRNTFAAEDHQDGVLRSSSGQQREWSMLQSFPTWGP